jgi:ribosomal-protein-alanine N-acetyltransferase
VIRPLNLEDANEIRLLRSDEKVNEFIGRSGTISHDEAKAFIDLIEKNTSKGESYYWAIALKENNSLIGTICLWNIDLEKEVAEIGYELLPAFQGKGIMQEAISAIIKFGFEKINLKIILALLEARNKRSITLLLKNNFLPDENFMHVSKEAAEGLIVYYLPCPIEKY